MGVFLIPLVAQSTPDITREARFSPESSDIYFYVNLASGRDFLGKHEIPPEDLFMALFGPRLTLENKRVRTFYEQAEQMFIIAQSQKVKEESGVLAFLKVKDDLGDISEFFPSAKEVVIEGETCYQLDEKRKSYLKKQGNIYVFGFMENIREYIQARKAGKTTNPLLEDEIADRALKYSLYIYLPFSAYTRNQMKEALEKGNGGKTSALQKNIYIQALINARSLEIAANAGERIEFTGVFTGEDDEQGERLYMLSHFMIVSSSIGISFMEYYIKKSNERKGLSKESSIDFEKIQSFFARLRTKQIPGGALMSLTLTREETHEVALIFSKVADNKRNEIAQKEREQKIRQLYSAIRSGDRERARALLDELGDRDIVDSKGRTPLHLAVQSGREEMASFLLERGFDVNVPTDNGKQTPLHNAVQTGSASMTRILLDAGADINARDAEGRGVMHMAARWGHNDLIPMLAKKGASVKMKNEKRSTPLHEAAGAGNLETVKLLIKLGADPESRDKYGATPADNARINRHDEVYRYLDKLTGEQQ